MSTIPVLSASANDLVYGRMPGGEFLIRNISDFVEVPSTDIPVLRAALLDVDQEPRLTFQFNDDTPHRVTETVSIAIGNDGKVVIVVEVEGGRLPCQTVELEIGDIGKVARAL